MSYAFDLSGSNRRALEALAAQTEWRRYQLDSAQLSLAGAVVATAVQQALLAAQIAALQQILAAQQEQLEITRARTTRRGHCLGHRHPANPDGTNPRQHRPAAQQR